jgi:hypothetical protein
MLFELAIAAWPPPTAPETAIDDLIFTTTPGQPLAGSPNVLGPSQTTVTIDPARSQEAAYDIQLYVNRMNAFYLPGLAIAQELAQKFEALGGLLLSVPPLAKEDVAQAAKPAAGGGSSKAPATKQPVAETPVKQPAKPPTTPKPATTKPADQVSAEIAGLEKANAALKAEADKALAEAKDDAKNVGGVVKVVKQLEPKPKK